MIFTKLRDFFKNVDSDFFVYDETRYADTFLSKNTGVRAEPSQLPKKVFVFWTGYNPMSENRKNSLLNLNNVVDMEICLVTPDNLDNYILPDAPLHPAYPYLSLVHKSDYLRCYFMNFYGGGYSDLKSSRHSWLRMFKLLKRNKNKYMIGYPEERIEDLAYVGGSIQQDLIDNYKSIAGNGAYICRSNTPFTNDWYAELQHRMDIYASKLQENPGNILGDNESYPIAWTGILGDIFHPLCLKYNSNIMLDNRLKPICLDYR